MTSTSPVPPGQPSTYPRATVTFWVPRRGPCMPIPECRDRVVDTLQCLSNASKSLLCYRSLHFGPAPALLPCPALHCNAVLFQPGALGSSEACLWCINVLSERLTGAHSQDPVPSRNPCALGRLAGETRQAELDEAEHRLSSPSLTSWSCRVFRLLGDEHLACRHQRLDSPAM